MSGMLMDERFVAVFPSLVRRLGSLEAAAILQHMHFSAEEDGSIRITHQQISDETGISERTVRRRVGQLRDDGWITTERAGGYDNGSVHHIVHERLIDAASLAASTGQSGAPEAASLAGSSLQNERTSTSQDVSSRSTARVEPEVHDRRGMFVGWAPHQDFVDYLRAAYPNVDLPTSTIRFVAFQIDNSRYSRSWENTFEAWVAEDQRRRDDDARAGGTDDMGRPLNQRRTSVVRDRVPGDEGYVDPEEIHRLAEQVAEAGSVTEPRQEQP